MLALAGVVVFARRETHRVRVWDPSIHKSFGLLQPVAAPSGSTNFAGISATGWIPPDCTLAAGPAHVLALQSDERARARHDLLLLP